MVKKVRAEKESSTPPSGVKRKAKDSVDAEEAADASKNSKKDKVLNKKQARRKEGTVLYAELINPGRDRPASEIVADIMEMLSERQSTLVEYISSKIGSRTLQACLKWGNRKQRQKLLEDLKADLPKLAINRFGHVVVLKLLTYAMKTAQDRKPTEEEKKAQAGNMKAFLEPFRGKDLHNAFYHKHGCKVINGIYFNETVSSKDKRRLLHDVAIPQAVSLLRDDTLSKPLRQILTAEDLSEDHRKSMHKHLKEAADKAVDKELLGFDITHFIFQAYCEHATEEQLKDLADKSMAGAPFLLSSKPGAEALLHLLGVTGAKDRKAFCKELKGKFAALTGNAVDYTVMIRLASTVDDTVLLQKTMLAEIIPELSTLCFDKYGRKVLAWFFRPADTRFFSPYEIKCANLPAPSSLKAPETRRQELMRVVRPAVRKVLMEEPLKAAADDYAKDVLLAYLSADWDAELIEALLKAGESEREEQDLGVLGNNGTVTTTLITLLKQRAAESDASFAGQMWKRCLQPKLTAAVTSRCAFVLLELLKQKGSTRDAIVAALKKSQKEVTAAIAAAEKAGAKVNGARKLLEEINK